MTWIYILLITEICLFFLAFIVNENDIMAPSVIMCAMFILSTSFAIASIDIWEMRSFEFNAFVILITGIFSFIVGEALYKLPRLKFVLSLPRNRKYEIDEIKPISVQSIILKFFILFDVVMLSWYVIEIKRIVGDRNLSMAIMAGMYRSMTVHMTVSDNIDGINSILSQGLKITQVAGLVTAYIFINNIFSGKAEKKQQVRLIILTVMSILPYLFSANRGEILKVFVAILFFCYVIWNQKYMWKRNISWKFIRIGIIIIVIGIPAFYFSLKLIGRTTDLGLMEYTAKYVGSSIYMFSLYTENPVSKAIAFGEESLIGLNTFLYRLGFNTYVRDVNLEYRSLHSNVYTFFRRPYHDFGLGGMYVFTIIVAFFFSWLYNGKIKKKRQSENVHIWILIMGYMFYWIVASSIQQLSFTYISINALIKIILIIAIFNVMTKIRFKPNTGR
ncbi:O-antigen polymerase [Hungatella sp.]|uniref:O-antigen polymerase n=1 Tax=Hungatella sp. TaxID=2613924 RepID=UPI002A82A000|nr:O-antigen polymerase [Hungatella sp.]